MFMRKLLFFHASWCPPCRFYEKQFISPLEELVGPEYIERVDAWITPQRAEKYLVDKLPTVVLLEGEKAVLQRTGAVNIDKVAEWLKGGDAFD